MLISCIFLKIILYGHFNKIIWFFQNIVEMFGKHYFRIMVRVCSYCCCYIYTMLNTKYLKILHIIKYRCNNNNNNMAVMVLCSLGITLNIILVEIFMRIRPFFRRILKKSTSLRLFINVNSEIYLRFLIPLFPKKYFFIDFITFY